LNGVQVSKLAKNGKMAVLEMSTEEAEEMRERGVEGHYVFIAPPSLADLDVRLRSSRPMEEMDLQELLMDARRQMERAAEPGAWDHVVVNTSEEVAFQSLKQVRVQRTRYATLRECVKRTRYIFLIHY
jgi:guanylate kinase